MIISQEWMIDIIIAFLIYLTIYLNFPLRFVVGTYIHSYEFWAIKLPTHLEAITLGFSFNDDVVMSQSWIKSLVLSCKQLREIRFILPEKWRGHEGNALIRYILEALDQEEEGERVTFVIFNQSILSASINKTSIHSFSSSPSDIS